jgi:putative transposase
MGLSRQAYYQGRQRNAERGERAETVVRLVNEHRIRQPRLGTRKLHHLLREPLEQAGIALGRDAMFDVLRNARMLVPTRRAYHKTTDSHHRFGVTRTWSRKVPSRSRSREANSCGLPTSRTCRPPTSSSI